LLCVHRQLDIIFDIRDCCWHFSFPTSSSISNQVHITKKLTIDQKKLVYVIVQEKKENADRKSDQNKNNDSNNIKKSQFLIGYATCVNIAND